MVFLQYVERGIFSLNYSVVRSIATHLGFLPSPQVCTSEFLFSFTLFFLFFSSTYSPFSSKHLYFQNSEENLPTDNSKASLDRQIGTNSFENDCPCAVGHSLDTQNTEAADFYFPTPYSPFSFSSPFSPSSPSLSSPSPSRDFISPSDFPFPHETFSSLSPQNSLFLSNFSFVCQLISYLHQAEQSDLFSRFGKSCRLNIEHYTNSLSVSSENVKSDGLDEGTRDSSFIPLSALIFVAADSAAKWKENEKEIESFYKKGIDSLIEHCDILSTPFAPLHTTSTVPLD